LYPIATPHLNSSHRMIQMSPQEYGSFVRREGAARHRRTKQPPILCLSHCLQRTGHWLLVETPLTNIVGYSIRDTLQVSIRFACHMLDLQVAVTFELPPTCFLQIGLMHSISAARSRCATSELILSTFSAAGGAGDKAVSQP
jgi:hypothetical protein